MDIDHRQADPESIRAPGNATTIRSADALHLVCARAHGLRRAYTNDRRMLLAAAVFGVEAVAV